MWAELRVLERAGQPKTPAQQTPEPLGVAGAGGVRRQVGGG